MEKIIHTASWKWVPKVSKYVIDVQFHGEPQQTFWVSKKQADTLINSLAQTKSGYSDKNVTVIAVMNEYKGKYYFGYAKVQYNGKFATPEKLKEENVTIDESLID